ncbi:MAG TPA: LPS export ABC transporter periplasmic protein LptC [Luteimonas sp.]|nr:LPS export ABC transporter periplasmic protein LptC [Luteimonas sp.]
MLLLVGAMVSGWSVWRQHAEQVSARTVQGRSDYVLHDFELVALDGTGKESFTLRAPTLQRNPGDRTMSLAMPLFLLPDQQGHYWEVRSRTGWVDAEGNEVRLRGNVRTTSPPQATRPIAMNTEQLNIFPDSNRATSAAVVTITQPGSILRGRGLEANLATKRYELQSEVRSRYAPSRQ